MKKESDSGDHTLLISTLENNSDIKNYFSVIYNCPKTYCEWISKNAKGFFLEKLYP